MNTICRPINWGWTAQMQRGEMKNKLLRRINRGGKQVIYLNTKVEYLFPTNTYSSNSEHLLMHWEKPFLVTLFKICHLIWKRPLHL